MKAEEFRTLLERATAGDKEAVEATLPKPLSKTFPELTRKPDLSKAKLLFSLMKFRNSPILQRL